MLSVVAMPFGFERPFLWAMGWSIDRMLDVATQVAGWSQGLNASPLLTPLALFIGLLALSWFSFFTNRWRLLGPALAVPAVLLLALDHPPDVLVSDTTQALAVRQAGGLALVAGKPDSFVVGVWQESNAEAALEALKEMQPESAVVVRDGGKRVSVPAKDLVPGDVVALAAGDRVPADARVLSLATATLRVEQASLTGESVAVHKDAEPVGDPRAAILDKSCMLFASTAVVSGSGLALVTSTG